MSGGYNGFVDFDRLEYYHNKLKLWHSGQLDAFYLAYVKTLEDSVAELAERVTALENNAATVDVGGTEEDFDDGLD